jgi:transcriptional regulator with XRE-family HTH domain
MKKGRPSTYRPEHAQAASAAYERGLTDTDVAGLLGITPSTLYRWRTEHPDFGEACVTAKALADGRVEEALYRRATGFEYLVERPYAPGPDGKPIVATYKQHVLPDWRASLQWLRIRRPKEWRAPQDDSGKAELHDIIEEAFLRVANKRKAEGRQVEAWIRDEDED